MTQNCVCNGSPTIGDMFWPLRCSVFLSLACFSCRTSLGVQSLPACNLFGIASVNQCKRPQDWREGCRPSRGAHAQSWLLSLSRWPGFSWTFARLGLDLSGGVSRLVRFGEVRAIGITCSKRFWRFGGFWRTFRGVWRGVGVVRLGAGGVALW